MTHRWQYQSCGLNAGYIRLHTHSVLVIRIAFLLQKLLHEGALALFISTLPVLLHSTCKTQRLGMAYTLFAIEACKHLNNNNTYYYYLLQLGCYPVAVVTLHVYKTWNWLPLN